MDHCLVPISNTALIISPILSYFDYGSTATLTCYVSSYATSTDIIGTAVNIQWTKSSAILESASIDYDTNFIHKLTNIRLSDAGEYNCKFFLTSPSNPYIIPSNVSTVATNVTVKSKFVFVTFVFISICSS